MYLSPYYYDGDQLGYTNAYNDMKGSNFFEGFLVYQSNITTIEPVHFFITWIFSNLYIEKFFLMSLINCFLSILIVKILQKLNINSVIIFLLLFTNFYVYVLYFSAERLKFSFIFLSLAVLNYENKKKLILYLILAIFTHLQNIILVSAIIFATFVNNFYSTNKLKLNKNKFLFIILLLLIQVLILKDQIYAKFSIYADISSANSFFKNTWQPILLYIFSLKFSTNKIFTSALFFIIIIASSLVGSDRITLFAYLCFLFYALNIQRGLNILNISFITYFLIKSVGFIDKVFENGHGF
jgi:hypothetical protein